MDLLESNRLIREYLRHSLDEDAYRRHTGKDFDVKERIAEYVDDSQTPEYYFTMTSIDKVGINPKTTYKTPVGICSYPLNSKYYKMLVSDKLPFVSKAPHCTILQLIKSGLLVVGDSSTQGVLTPEQSEVLQFKAMKMTYPDYDDSELFERLEILQDENTHFRKNLDARLFGLTYILTEKQGAMAWNLLLRKLGFSAIQDPGFGIIHPSEPTQCIFLTRSACNIIESFDTQAIRRDTSPEAVDQQKILTSILIDPTIEIGPLSDSVINKCRDLLSKFSILRLGIVLTNPSLSRNGWAYARAWAEMVKHHAVPSPELLSKMTPEALSNVVRHVRTSDKPNVQMLKWLLQRPQPESVRAAMKAGFLSEFDWSELLLVAKWHKIDHDWNK